MLYATTHSQKHTEVAATAVFVKPLSVKGTPAKAVSLSCKAFLDICWGLVHGYHLHLIEYEYAQN